jgi:2-polyprenyl-3-methyl-5-hydroxy-6-metoxy-1,4-benzoquinol methylase
LDGRAPHLQYTAVMTAAPAKAATIDTVKAYWDARPCNIRHSKLPVGSKEYFNEVEKRKYYVEPHIPAFAQFERWKGKRVLEVGCGIGTDTINFARAGAQVTAVDLSSESISVAKKRAEVFGFGERVRFCQADAERLSEFVPVEPYDLVYSFGVIHHTPNPPRAAHEIRKFMGRDSELRLMLYAKNSWKHIMIEAGYDQPEAQSGCPVAFTYTHEEIRRELLEGFDVCSIEQAHIFPFVVEKYIEYEYEIVPWFAAMPREMFRALEKNLGWHALIVARLPR